MVRRLLTLWPSFPGVSGWHPGGGAACRLEASSGRRIWIHHTRLCGLPGSPTGQRPPARQEQPPSQHHSQTSFRTHGACRCHFGFVSSMTWPGRPSDHHATPPHLFYRWEAWHAEGSKNSISVSNPSLSCRLSGTSWRSSAEFEPQTARCQWAQQRSCAVVPPSHCPSGDARSAHPGLGPWQSWYPH